MFVSVPSVPGFQGGALRVMATTGERRLPSLPAVTDLLSNRIQAMFNLVTGALPQIRGGEVIPLAILDDARSPQLPDVPTMAEAGMAGLTFGTWFMVMAPKGTPGPIIDRFNTLVNEVIADPEAKQRLEGAGLVLLGGTRQRAAEFLAVEIRRHAEIVRASGARID